VADIRAPDEVFDAVRPEAVFHLAAQAGVRPSLDDPMHDASVNLMGTLNVVECAIKVGARKVIYAASGGTIYGEPKRIPAKESAAQGSHPMSPYGISKKVVVDYLGFYQRYRGLDYTALALGNVFGPLENLRKAADDDDSGTTLLGGCPDLGRRIADCLHGAHSHVPFAEDRLGLLQQLPLTVALAVGEGLHASADRLDGDHVDHVDSPAAPDELRSVDESAPRRLGTVVGNQDLHGRW